MGWQPQQPSMPQQKGHYFFDSLLLLYKRREVKLISYSQSTILHLQMLQSMV
jgi:hypothetical protein